MLSVDDTIICLQSFFWCRRRVEHEATAIPPRRRRRPWASNPFPHTPRPVLPVPRLVPAAPRHPGAQWWMICGGAAALSTKPPPSPAGAGAAIPRPWAPSSLPYTPRPVLSTPRLVLPASRPRT